MLNFCTLFDSNYISRGLALFESLKTSSRNFHLYVVAFDDPCYDYLKNLQEDALTVISLNEFEDEKLKEVKPSRSAAEYCWTCTPSIILYCIEKYQISSCTYVDADMIFYDDPQILFNEMVGKSILITEHRYTRDYDVSATHGIYCVQFMYFKNDQQGMNALRWWRDRCLEWCYSYLEDGKFGDQKYLDDWIIRFPGVHVLQHPGGGLAPWNVQQYVTIKKENKIYLRSKKTAEDYPLIFFHFHGLKFFSDDKVSCCGALYELDDKTKSTLYIPYIRQLIQIGKTITASGFKPNPQGARGPSPTSWETVSEYSKNIIFLILKGQLAFYKKEVYQPSLHNHIYKTSIIQ